MMLQRRHTSGLHQRGGGWYDWSVNKVLGKQYLRDGERHPIMWLQDGTKRPGEYLGPGSHVMDKMREGVKPISDIDAISARHDLAYSLARNAEDVRAADNHMLDRIANVEKNKSDSRWNINLAKRGIQAKVALENAGLATTENFTSYGGMDDPEERAFAQEKMDALTQQGFGRDKKTGQFTTWRQHVAEYRKKHPKMSYKQCLKAASKTYRK